LADGELRIAYQRTPDGYLVERPLQRYAQLGAGIIESGGDETNGYWTKYSNGDLIYEKRASGVTSSNSSNLFGSSSGTTYYADVVVTFPVAVPFVSIKSLVAVQNNPNIGYTASVAYADLLNCHVYLTSAGSASQTVTFSVVVKGRWR
jgi:hypothetical protein